MQLFHRVFHVLEAPSSSVRAFAQSILSAASMMALLGKSPIFSHPIAAARSRTLLPIFLTSPPSLASTAMNPSAINRAQHQRGLRAGLPAAPVCPCARHHARFGEPSCRAPRKFTGTGRPRHPPGSPGAGASGFRCGPGRPAPAWCKSPRGEARRVG